MSGTAADWALEVRGIKLAAKAILQILCAHHNYTTGQCNPSVETLCEESGLKERAVYGHLRTLEEAGLIKRETESLGRGRGKRTYYILNFSNKKALDPPANEDLQVQDFAGAKDYTCKISHLQVQSFAKSPTPPNKDITGIEPERSNRQKIESTFEAAWTIYRASEHRVASISRSKALEQWRKVCKTQDPDKLFKALEYELRIRENPQKSKRFLGMMPDLFRWLRDGKWEATPAFSEQPNLLEPVPTEEFAQTVAKGDWIRWHTNWQMGQGWPRKAGPAPDQPGCLMPQELLNDIQQKQRKA